MHSTKESPTTRSLHAANPPSSQAGTTSTQAPRQVPAGGGVTDKVIQFVDEPPLFAVFGIIAVGAGAALYALNFTASSINIKRE